MDNFNIFAKYFINSAQVGVITMSFYDKNGKLVGYIDIDQRGRMSWQIVDLRFKEYFFGLLPFLYAGDIKERISYQCPKDDINYRRWSRARVFIQNKKLNIKYGNGANEVLEREAEQQSIDDEIISFRDTGIANHR